MRPVVQQIPVEEQATPLVRFATGHSRIQARGPIRRLALPEISLRPLEHHLRHSNQ